MTEDDSIIDQFFSRDENALRACREKYGVYLTSIIRNILKNHEDSEECLNDVLYAAWESIPPKNPENLRAYLAVIARNKAFDRIEYAGAQKRSAEVESLLEEIDRFTPSDSPEELLLAQDLKHEIDAFLSQQDRDSRVCFVLRYFYAADYETICKKTGKTKHNVVALLSKMRKRLKDYLKTKGYHF